MKRALEEDLKAIQSVDWDNGVFSLGLCKWQCLKVEPRNMSSLLNLPLADLPKHIKRVKKIQGEPNCVVLVAPEDCSVDESILTASGFPKQIPMLVEIPTTPPRLKSQIPKYNEFWPCQYYEHIPDTRLVSELSDKEKQSFVRYMNETLDLAENSKLSVACCIVNMEGNEVMGRGIEDDDAHCVMRAIEDAAAKLREKKLKMQKHCTDYVVFTNHEPCVMCSMALVHSRVRCVVFGTRCRDGGLSGEIRLGSMKQLNHRFDVYEGCCLERCQSIKKQCF